MDNELFMKKLMDVPFIVSVKILREHPCPKIPKEMLKNDRSGLISPVVIRNEKYVISPEWRNGIIGEPHMMDVANPYTGGMFRIRILLEDESIAFAKDDDYARELEKYFKEVIRIASSDYQGLIQSFVSCRYTRGNHKTFKNPLTESVFMCKDPYDPTITEDGDIIFGPSQLTDPRVDLYAQLYAERMKLCKDYADKRGCAVVTNSQKKDEKKSDIESVSDEMTVYIVTDTTRDGGYTPSVFKTLKEAQEWMREVALNNFIVGNSSYLGEIYSRFFEGEKNPYKKLLSIGGGSGAFDVFIECFLNGDDGNIIEDYRAAIYYPDDSYNKLQIYKLTFDKGVPMIRPCSNNEI